MASKVRVSGFPYVPAHWIWDKNNEEVDGTAMVRVEAPPHVVEARLSVDLVTVVDVRGESRLDVVKKAMKFVISQLSDKDHRFAIVAFNDNVVNDYTTELSKISGDDGRKLAEEKVDKLMANGDTTAFKPPLEYAVNKILEAREDKSRRPGFILLVSDGEEDSKFKRDDIRRLLADAQYPVYTFGLGTAHDSKALYFVAKESNGTYSSILDNLESKIMEAFAVFLGGLNTIVAVNTNVNIKVPYEEDEKVRIKIVRIDSGGYKNTISRDGTSGDISVGILFADEVKDFIVYYKIRNVNSKPKIYTLYFKHALFNADVHEVIPGIKSINPNPNDTFKLTVLVGHYSPHHESKFSDEEKKFLPYANVLQQMVRFSILEQLIAFLNAMDTEKGDNLALQTRWEAFKKSDEFWKEAEKFRLDLGGLNQDITAMVSNMEQGLGVACIYSWVSSYQMQRATTTGLPSATAAFLTNSMKAMIKTARNKSETDAAPQQPLGEESRKCKLAFDLLGRIDTQLDLLLKLQDTVAGTESHTRDMAGLVHPGIGLVHQGIHQTMKQAIGEWRASQ